MPEPDRNDGRWQPGCLVALAALVAVFVGFGAVMVACGNSLSHIGEGIAVPNFSKSLAAIPVPSASCAPLRAVQLTAADAGQSWGTVFTNPSDTSSWHSFAAQLGPRLARFDVALHAAVPRTPAPIAAELRDVIRKVDVGRVQLPHAQSEADYATLTNNAVLEGYASLGRASDLMGDACGFTLAPGLDVVFPTTTTTLR
jgi:hypothetical protein